MPLQLLAKLGRETGQGGERELGRNGNRLILAEARDVELLPLDVDRIARVDRELLGDVSLDVSDVSPDGLEPRDIDFVIAQQIERPAHGGVSIEGEPELGGLVGRQREAAEE